MNLAYLNKHVPRFCWVQRNNTYVGMDKSATWATVYPTLEVSRPEDPESYATLWYVKLPGQPPFPFRDWKP